MKNLPNVVGKTVSSVFWGDSDGVLSHATLHFTDGSKLVFTVVFMDYDEAVLDVREVIKARTDENS